jgi:FtsH-binding integral membrane protein
MADVSDEQIISVFKAEESAKEETSRSMQQCYTCLKLCLLIFGCLAYTSTLKMEAVISFKASVKFCQATRRQIPGDNALQEFISFTVHVSVEECVFASDELYQSR